MTIKELYDWAIRNGVEDFELLPVEEDHAYSFEERNLRIYKEDKTVEID